MSRSTPVADAPAGPPLPSTAAVPPASTAEKSPEKGLRADARRNRDALLAAGAEVFAERGPDASLEEIARRAGVGIGTLYRHFPDRDALTEAVYRNEVEHLCDVAAGLLAEHSADEALSVWMRSFASYAATKRGMMVALKSSLGADNELFTYSGRRIRESLAALIDAAAAEGSIRADVDGESLLTALRGICMAGDSTSDTDRNALLIGLLVDGLRYGAPGRA